MDPDACYQEINDAMEEVNRLLAAARKNAVALHAWLEKGGFYPSNVSESEVRIVLSQVFLRTEEADDE